MNIIHALLYVSECFLSIGTWKVTTVFQNSINIFWLPFQQPISSLHSIEYCTITIIFTISSPPLNITQSCWTLCDPMDCSSPGSSVHGISQAGILEWVSISFSRGSSRPRDRTQVSCIAGRLYRLSHQGSPRMIFITIIFSIIITVIIISASLHVGKGSLTSWGSLLSL